MLGGGGAVVRKVGLRMKSLSVENDKGVLRLQKKKRGEKGGGLGHGHSLLR